MAGTLRSASILCALFRPSVGHLRVLSPLPRTIHRTFHESPSWGQMTSNKAVVGKVKLHYDRVGTGNQILLLMPGALGSSKTDFKYQIENINKDLFTLIAWDPRGYGQSYPPERDWPTDWLRRDAEDAARLMQTLGTRKFSILGWSDGGITALLLAMKYPERVDKIIIWGTATYVTEEDAKANESIRNIDDWSARMRAPFDKVYPKDYMRTLCNDWVDAYNGYRQFSNGDICSNELGKIQSPTLILHGKKDPLVGQFHADHIHANIPNSKLINLPDGKHNIHMKYYKIFNSLVEQFLINPAHVQSRL